MIISIVSFLASVYMVFRREMLAPLFGFLGLLFMWLSGLLPLNGTIIIMWLCMSVLVMVVPMLQTQEMRSLKAGKGYMLVGALTGMAVGLLGFSFAGSLSLLYGIMIVAVLAGTFFGFVLFSNTPKGRPYALARRGSFSYLLAKGFPIAITVMEIGVIFVLLLAVSNADRLAAAAA